MSIAVLLISIAASAGLLLAPAQASAYDLKLVTSKKIERLFDSSEIKSRIFFGNCPVRLTSILTSNLVDEFKVGMSLMDVKKKILEENLQKKNFISLYNIKYNPLAQLLEFFYDCPAPLSRVSVYEREWSELYRAILGNNGKLYDPTYEIILREEKKLNQELPVLALPLGEVDKSLQSQITTIMKGTKFKYKNFITEYLINQDKELTIILSYNGSPITTFFGSNVWEQKIYKLERIIEYLRSKLNPYYS
ncbi:MAG: hypothetical protein HQK53_09730 [Oligoflexia bacterium]|nr:hypothetical protein [Oligoflexia bacterium]